MTEIQAMKRSFRDGLILSLIMFSVLCFPGSGATIDSIFHSQVDNGETTFYNYLKQSDLKESSFTRGLETGSLNYFKGSATVDDHVVYYDGKIDDRHKANATNTTKDYMHNSTVDHTLVVNYEGEKGLSLFYAKGFYRSNRAITASKKVWFGNDSYYRTKSIDLKGHAKMDMGGIYLMDYNINSAENAIFVFNDAAGFSNKTGSRRIDFEQEGLIKGDIRALKNELRVQDEYIARAGINEEWLPCICGPGLIPPVEPIEGNDSAWPSKTVKQILVNPKQFPPAEKTITCVDCGDDDCEARNLSAGGGSRGGKGQIIVPPDLFVEAIYTKEDTSDESWNIYEFTIEVKNTGYKELEDVQLVAQLLLDEDKWVYVKSSGSIDDLWQEPDQDRVSKTLVWKLGTLKPVLPEPEAKRTVLMKVNSSEDISKSIQFYAQYKIGSNQDSTVPVSPIGEISTGLWRPR